MIMAAGIRLLSLSLALMLMVAQPLPLAIAADTLPEDTAWQVPQNSVGDETGAGTQNEPEEQNDQRDQELERQLEQNEYSAAQLPEPSLTTIAESRILQVDTSLIIEKLADGRIKATFQQTLVGSQDGTGIIAANFTRIQIPTWSAVNGQDDLRWYEASKNPNGTWSIVLDWAQHNYEGGLYHLHTYAVDQGGARTSLRVDTAILEAPLSAQATLATDEKSVRVTLDHANLIPSDARVQFPTWSLVNGQDDLRWYNATRSGTTFTCTIPLSNHKSTGAFATHTYVSVAGKSMFAGAASFTIQTAKDASLSIQPQANGTVKATLQATAPPASVTHAQIAVWTSVNWQDDLKWYEATRAVDGSWSVTIDWRQHNYEGGNYYFDAYIIDGNGAQSFVCGKLFPLQSPLRLTAELTANEKQITLTLTGANHLPSDARIQIPTWSETDGQDDLIWYEATRKGSTFTLTITLSTHKSVGRFISHAYAIVGGKFTYVGGTTFDLTRPSQGSIEVKRNEQGIITATLTCAEPPQGISSVSIPTWTSNKGQDDLKWYVARKNTDSTWSITLDWGQHGLESGQYIFHAYATDGNGAQSFVCGLTQTLTAADFISITSTVAEDERTVRIEMTGATLLPSATVKFPTWSYYGGQDDLQWYPAVRQGNLFVCTVPIANHKTGGLYATDVYVEQAGRITFVGGTSFTITPVPTGFVSVTPLSTNRYKVRYTTNQLVIGGIVRVQIPTWSLGGGQDDLIWHDASPVDGGYEYILTTREHWYQSDTYMFHVYVTAGNDVVAFSAATTSYISSTGRPTPAYYSQRINATVGGYNFYYTGCVPTTLAMAYSAFGGGLGGPLEVGRQLNLIGGFNNGGAGAGGADVFISALANGFNCEALPGPDAINAALRRGDMVVSMTTYSSVATHCALAWGMDCRVYDPLDGPYNSNAWALWNNRSWASEDWANGSCFFAIWR